MTARSSHLNCALVIGPFRKTNQQTMNQRTLEYQKIYQSRKSVPLWMRSPRSKLLVYPFYALFAFSSVLVPAYYTGVAITGKHYD